MREMIQSTAAELSRVLDWHDDAGTHSLAERLEAAACRRFAVSSIDEIHERSLRDFLVRCLHASELLARAQRRDRLDFLQTLYTFDDETSVRHSLIVRRIARSLDLVLS